MLGEHAVETEGSIRTVEQWEPRAFYGERGGVAFAVGEHKAPDHVNRVRHLIREYPWDVISIEYNPERYQRHIELRVGNRRERGVDVYEAIRLARECELPIALVDTGYNGEAVLRADERYQNQMEARVEAAAPEADSLIERIRNVRQCLKAQDAELYRLLFGFRDDEMAGHLVALREAGNRILHIGGSNHLPGIVDQLRDTATIPDDCLSIPPIRTRFNAHD